MPRLGDAYDAEPIERAAAAGLPVLSPQASS
jgi:hypothetical protein